MFPKHQSGLSVVSHYVHLYEADLAKGLLASEGVDAWILDEHQVRQQWHLAMALGGVKLAVAPEDLECARAILAEDRSDLLVELAEQAQPPHPDELCPRCGRAAISEHVSLRVPRPLQWLVMFVFLLPGALVPRRRLSTTSSCGGCGHAWAESVIR